MKSKFFGVFFLIAGFVHAGIGESKSSKTIVIGEVKEFVLEEVPAQVNISDKGPFSKLTLDASSDLLKDIKVKFNNGKLKIFLPKYVKKIDSNRLSIAFASKILKKIKVKGAAIINMEGNHRGEELDVQLKGNHRFRANNLAYDKINIRGAGNNELNLAGKTRKLDIDLKGNSSGKLKNLVSGQSKVEFSGVTDIEIGPSDKIEIEISGMGTIYYYGSRSSVASQKIKGMATIKILGGKAVKPSSPLVL